MSKKPKNDGAVAKAVEAKVDASVEVHSTEELTQILDDSGIADDEEANLLGFDAPPNDPGLSISLRLLKSLDPDLIKAIRDQFPAATRVLGVRQLSAVSYSLVIEITRNQQSLVEKIEITL